MDNKSGQIENKKDKLYDYYMSLNAMRKFLSQDIIRGTHMQVEIRVQRYQRSCCSQRELLQTEFQTSTEGPHQLFKKKLIS